MIRRFIVPVAGLALVMSLPAVASAADTAFAARAVPATGPRAAGATGVTAYVTNSLSGTVTPIRTATNTPGKAIKVGSNPGAIAITP